MPLFVVATPIGNLEDITERAKKVLSSAEVVICENKERALRLLRHLGVRSKKIIYLPAPVEKQKSEKVAEEIKDKDAVLIVSAGTPAISDPGGYLVRTCISKGIKVIPIPGVSALTCALSVCGMPTNRYLFVGFPPKNGRENFFRKIKEGIEKFDFIPAVVFFESPHRVIDTLIIVKKVFGDIPLFFGREMTKLYEEYILGKIGDITQELQKRGSIKGEITVIIFPQIE